MSGLHAKAPDYGKWMNAWEPRRAQGARKMTTDQIEAVFDDLVRRSAKR